MLANIIESARRSSLRPAYIALILLGLAATVIIGAIAHTGIPGKPVISDFDAFYMASKLVLAGDIAQSHDPAGYIRQQIALLGRDYHLSWNYPPPYDLVVAPLSLLPRGLAFGLFMALPGGLYLWALHRLAGDHFVTALLLMATSIFVVVFFGQNGLLTGALVALAALGLRDRRTWAGIPLGLMIIKPHLALALALYVVVDRRWRIFFAAAATVTIASLLPLPLLGADIWSAFLIGIRNTAWQLQANFYPFARMVSAYAAARSATTTALGLAALLSLMFSPYAYDYDVPVIGAGLALLLPDLVAHGTSRERSVLYALLLATAGYGLAYAAFAGGGGAGLSPAGKSPAGLFLVIAMALAWRIVRRSSPQ
jgi:hypothetical protein